MNLELKKAIDQISKDKGLDRDMLVDTLEDAVRTSVIRKYGENIDVEVSYNDDTGEIQVHQFKIVVDDVADPDTEIDIEKARAIQYDADRIIYKMCEAHGNLYAVQKEILRRMYGLELGGVRAPMPNLACEDEKIVAQAQAMIEAAIAKL